MKIVKAETLHADGGYRSCSYLKLSTDEGLVGWSEFYDSFSGARIDPLIQDFARTAMGMDPRQFGRVSETLIATTRLAAGGLAQQAIAAIENACLDIAGKAMGVPVHTLLGGPLRDRVPVYWTHCGSYRVGPREDFYAKLGYPPIRTLQDLTDVAREAVAQGYRAVKTNPVFFDKPKPYFFSGGFRPAPGFLDRSINDRQLAAIQEQMIAYREAVGPNVGLMLDVSFSQRTEGYLRIAQRLEHLNLAWRSPRWSRCTASPSTGPSFRTSPWTPASSTRCGTASGSPRASPPSPTRTRPRWRRTTRWASWAT